MDITALSLKYKFASRMPAAPKEEVGLPGNQNKEAVNYLCAL
jgi:hypothetical protein